MNKNSKDSKKWLLALLFAVLGIFILVLFTRRGHKGVEDGNGLAGAEKSELVTEETARSEAAVPETSDSEPAVPGSDDSEQGGLKEGLSKGLSASGQKLLDFCNPANSNFPPVKIFPDLNKFLFLPMLLIQTSQSASYF